MALDSEKIRKELIANSYTRIKVHGFEAEIKRPYPGLLLKNGIAPHILYDTAYMVLYPEELAHSLREKRRSKKKQEEEQKEKIDITARVIKTICEIIIEPELSPEAFSALEVVGEEGVDIQLAFINLVTGKYEEITSEDLIEYAKGGLRHDAISFQESVARRIGLGGTITGYDLDLAAGLYIQHHRNELLKAQMGVSASTAGYQLIGTHDN